MQSSITRRAVALALAAALLLPGCISAQRRINANQAELYAEAITETERVARQLEQGGPGAHDLRFYFGNDFINQSLRVLNGYTIVLPNEPDIDLRITSAELANLGALPALSLSAVAAGGSVSADVLITAVLVPSGRPHEFRIMVKSLAPNVRFRSLNVSRLPFVDRLLNVRAIDVTEGLPTIRFPVEERVSIGGPAGTAKDRVQTTRNPDSSLAFATTFPATAWTARIVNPRYFFVKNGVYVFGDVR